MLHSARVLHRCIATSYAPFTALGMFKPDLQQILAMPTQEHWYEYSTTSEFTQSL